MSHWKNRMEQSSVSSTRSPAKPRNLVKPKPNSTSNANSIRLPGIEEMAQSDGSVVGSGVPFILVDGMCTKTRQQLHVALSKCEKRRMKWIQRQCCVLPLLKYMKPATRTEPTTPAEKEAREEVDFQEDLKQLCIAELTVGDTKDRTGTVTPIAHATSTEDLLQNKPRLEQIRSQLEELRQKQEEESISSDNDFFPMEQPKLMRQGTFDVKHDERLIKNSSSSSLSSFKGKCLANNSNLMRSITMSQSRLNSPQTKNTTNCLFKNKSYTLLPPAKKPNRLPSVSAPNSTELPNIINKIGDLLLQLPLQQEEEGQQEDKTSFAYLVTITPSQEKMADKSQPSSTSSRPTTPYDPTFFCSNRSSQLSDTDPTSALSSTRSKPPTPAPKLESRTSSFLKMSSKLLKKLKN